MYVNNFPYIFILFFRTVKQQIFGVYKNCTNQEEEIV